MYAVVLNPNATPETLQMLAKDEYRDVRWNVARNPNTDQCHLVKS